VPSPVGHSLGVLALIGFLRQDGRALSRRTLATALAVISVAAIAPDFDFIPGILIGDNNRFHHGPSHSFAAAILAGLACWLVARASRFAMPVRLGVLTGASYASHILLDMLTTDGLAPYGVPVFWPWSVDRLSFPIHIFVDIKRAPGVQNFFVSLLVPHNAWALAREAAIVATTVLVYRLAGAVVGRGLRRAKARRLRTTHPPATPDAS
jgi:inner membrane protein